MQQIKDAVELLRKTGEKWIQDRKTAIENGEDVPKTFSHKSSKQQVCGSQTAETFKVKFEQIIIKLAAKLCTFKNWN